MTRRKFKYTGITSDNQTVSYSVVVSGRLAASAKTAMDKLYKNFPDLAMITETKIEVLNHASQV